ncbi:collagen-like protein [Lactiplantibacillus plantarum]|uniref:collagen-like protein n=1 Tax=Lactiplantibacillus plantarum TaxID=1590 RepID=UPI00338EA18C
MAKTLSFTDTSPQTVKIGDTTTSFTLICGNDNVATDLTKDTSITVKLGNASGYLKSATVDPASLTDPTTGQVTVTFNADLMTSLTAGSYAIEVWVVDSTGTSIYPSDGSTGFTIANNIQSANGSVITTITFDDFVKELNKAASTIDKGDKGDDGLSAYQVAVINGYHGSQTDWLASLKGDTGTVDNAGLISAPAFQSLQAQVDNSAVGNNLLVGTANFYPWTGTSAFFNNGNLGLKLVFEKDSDGDIAWHLSGTANGSGVVGAFNAQLSSAYPSTYAFSASVKGTFANTSLYEFQVEGCDSNNIVSINWSSTYSRWVATGNVASGNTGATVLYFNIKSGDTIDIWVKKWKLEKGSVATDWCLNPAEILTQSDYAKIKAAIVALGGSLS